MFRGDADDSSVLVVACKGRVFGLDRTSGERRWEVVVTDDVDRLAGGFAVELLMTPERVYAASWFGDDVVCIGYPGGEEIGRAAIGFEGRGRPMMVVQGDDLFVARAGQVASLTLDGKLQWTAPLVVEPEIPMALGFPGNVRQADDRRGR